MEKITLMVEGMSCEHCVKAVKGAVGALQGIANTEVDLGAKSVVVEFDGSKTSVEQIKAAIDDQGYEIIS